MIHFLLFFFSVKSITRIDGHTLMGNWCCTLAHAAQTGALASTLPLTSCRVSTFADVLEIDRSVVAHCTSDDRRLTGAASFPGSLALQLELKGSNSDVSSLF